MYDNYHISVIDTSFDGILGILFKDKITEYCFAVFWCYLPPENSPYGRDSTSFFTHLLSMLYLHSYVDSCFCFGDFNSRVSNEADNISIIDEIPERSVIDFTLNNHGESFLDFLKESRMVITQGRITGQNNFTSISSRGKSCVDFMTVSIENIDQCTDCNVILTSDIISSKGLESLISENCKPPDHSPVTLSFYLVILAPLENSMNAQNSNSNNNTSRRYMFDTMSEDFLNSTTWQHVLDSFIQRLEFMSPSQKNVDTFYDDMLKEIFHEMDSHIKYKDSSKKVRKYYRSHKPFWTDELTSAWKAMSEAEKAFTHCKHSHVRNKQLHEDFIHKRKLFDKLLRCTERKYNRKKAIDIETINTKNPNEFWKQVNSLGPKRSMKIPMEVYNDMGPGGGIKVRDENYVFEKWKDEFHSLYNMPSDINTSFDNVFYDDIKARLPDIKLFELENSNYNNMVYNRPFSNDEFDRICNSLKQGKAAGPDMIPNEVLRHVGIKKLLVDFINMCFTKNIIPSVWRLSIISPIPKSASKDPYVPLNYRGISLLSCMYKLYSAALNSRITSHCELNDLLVDEQNGFRSKRSCQDHIFVLSSIIKNRKLCGQNTFCAFVDFQKAFDWVSRDLLLYKLNTFFNIHGRLFNSLSTIYSSSISKIKLNGKLSSSFDVTSGVKQGDIISPVLFSMYLNDLATGIKDLNCGIDINGFNCSILLYADDIVLIAPNEESLQKMLDFIKNWCDKWRMAINADKTQVVHFRQPSSPQSDFSFRFGDSTLQIVQFYKYLGVIFDENLTFEKNASVLADAACRALGAIRSKLKNLKSCGYNTFNTLVMSGVLTISDYSAGIWGTKKFPKSEQVGYKAARYFMGVHRFAPIDALLGDMGWLSAKSRHKTLLLKQWNRFCNLPENRLTRRVFEWDHLYSNKRGAWSSAAKHIFNEIGCNENFFDLSCCNIDHAVSILSYQDDVDWQTSRYKSDKLRYYNLYKAEKNVEDYLLLDLSKYQRSVFAQFRCGILPLQIEIGRFRNIELSNRICQVCHTEVEDEIHFLLTCDAFVEPRTNLYQKAYTADKAFPTYDVYEKFTFLMSNLQKPVIKFLTNALAIRSKLLTVVNND